ncbi:MAG: VWA domain-containing protein [Planctomycetota bacterium]
MPIHYRCRCGQEVTLRPREGVYLLVALLVGMTLINTALTTLLWLRWGSPHPQSVQEPASRSGEDQVDDTPTALETALKEVQEDLGVDRAGSPSLIPTEMTRGEELEQVSMLPISSGLERDDLQSAKQQGAVLSGSSQSETTMALSTAPREYTFPRPQGLDALAMWMLLNQLPESELQRAMVLLGSLRWGSGVLRTEVHQRLASEPKRFEELAAVWLSAPLQDDSVRISDDGLSWKRNLLGKLEQQWQEGWNQLLHEGGKAEVRRWTSAARKRLAGAAEFLVLVDLSESMAEEAAATAQALRLLVPLTFGSAVERRWGWIGYRDEVVESFPLTTDGEAFLSSLSRWSCQGGGDVPEGLDQAIFEALRVGGIDWSPEARHIFFVVGDAPPPYERIPEMISLVRAAHATPEAYTVNCLGILREAQWDSLASFRELAEISGGQAIFYSPGKTNLESWMLETWWRLIMGSAEPSWRSCPL